MFSANIFSNGDVGSEDYVNELGLTHYDDYVSRVEFIDECLQRLVYEKDYLKGLMDND